MYHLGDDQGSGWQSPPSRHHLYGKAPDAFLWFGKALKRASTLDQAEEALSVQMNYLRVSRPTSLAVGWTLS